MPPLRFIRRLHLFAGLALVGLAPCGWFVTSLMMWWRLGTARRTGLIALVTTTGLMIAVVGGMWMGGT